MVDQRFFPGVHALRAIAATLVVFQHAVFFANPDSYVNEFPINYGRLGVAIFFSISGFVIALNRAKPIGEFVAHRLLRIYPIYWITIVASIALLALSRQHSSASLAATLLLPSTQGSSLAIPYWTLVYEVTFYAVASALFWARLSDSALTITAIVWIGAINLFGFEPANTTQLAFPGYSILLSPIMQILPMGFILGIHFEKLANFPALFLGIVAVCCYSISLHFPDPTIQRHFFLGICTTSIVAVSLRVNSNLPVARFLGNASYGIYLIHFSVMQAAATSHISQSSFVSVALLFLLSMLVGTGFGTFDHWQYRMLVRLSARRSRVFQT